MSASPARLASGVLAGLLLLALALTGVERGIDVALLTKTPSARNSKLADFDELWHLETGRVIAESGHVPDRDPFTFTAGETPWTNTNWLAQLVLWELYRAGGIELDWLLGIALWLGAVALVHARARRRTRASFAALPGTLYVLIVLRRTSEVRPQGWTFLLLAAALLLLDAVSPAAPSPSLPRSAGEGVAQPLLLGAILALADQLHGGFVFLHGAVFLAGLGAAISARKLRAAKPHAIALGVGLAGFLLHPHHLDALRHPFRYALDARIRFMASRTGELMPPDLRGVTAFLIFAPIVVLALASVRGARRFKAQDALLTTAFFALALSSARGLHYFAIVVAGPLATALEDASLVRLVEPLEDAWRACARLAPLALLAAFFLTFGVRASALAPGKPGDMSDPLLSSHADVAEMASFVSGLPQTRILNRDETGSALIWKGWPRQRVFCDTRGDFHALTGAFAELVTIWNARDDWESLVAKHGCELALVERGVPIEAALRARGWRVLRENASLVLLARPSKNE